MKKYLHLLALVVASAIPGLAMAATDYGITICGTKVTSDNASNITGSWLKSGTIRYNYSSNKLTFDNVNIYADGGIYVYNTCKDALHMRFNGINTISTNTVAFSIQKANGYSNVDVYFEGDGEGILNLNWHSSSSEKLYDNGIYCQSTNGNYPWVCIGNGTQGGEGTHSALTVNATSISGAGGGSFYITDGVVNLMGYGSSSSLSSIHGFSNVYVNGTGNGIWTEGVSYSSSNKRLEKNGSNYPGAVYAGWQKYGLRICGSEVTCRNKSDFKVYTNSSASRPVLQKNDSYGTAAADGAIKYDPSTNKLTLTNVAIWDNYNSNRGEAVIDNQTGKNLNIYTYTASTIVRSDGEPCGVRSNKNLTFTGLGALEIVGTTADNATGLVVMNDDNLTLSFEGCNVTLTGNGTSAPAIVCANSSHTMTLETSVCNLTTTGVIYNVGTYTPNNTAIKTEGIWWQSAQKRFTKQRSNGRYTGKMEIAQPTQRYGLFVAGIDVNDVSVKNMWSECLRDGTITYDATNGILNLKDTKVDMSYWPGGSQSALVINNPAPNGLKINIEGDNTWTGYRGANAAFIQRETNASLNYPCRYFTGTGTLDLGTDGFIALYDEPWICIGNGLQGGEGKGGCTIKACSIYGYGGKTARLGISDGTLELYGSEYGTLTEIDGLYISGMVMTPSNVTYNSSENRLEQNGALYTGPLRIGWEEYALTIGGTKVTAGNKNDIRITTHKSAQNLAMADYSSQTPTEAASGAVKYDPSTNTLTLTNVKILDVNNTAYGEAVIDNQTGTPFILKTSGNAELRTAYEKQKAVIRSNSNITFKGGQLTAKTTDRVSSCLLMDGNHLMATFDNSSKTNLESSSGSGSVAGVMDVANPGDKMRVKVNKCTMEMNGSCENFEYWEFSGSEIQTANVFVDEDKGMLCKNFNGVISKQDYTTDIVPVTTEYGIKVGGHALNDINKDNFYYADVKGTVLYDPDEKVLYLEDVTSQCAPRKNINSSNNVVEWHSNGINVTSSAPADLRIELSGTNRFQKISGVGMSIHKDTKITGTGSLYLEQPNDNQGHIVRASIYLYDKADLSLLENVEVYANEVVGSEGNGGNLIFFEDDPTKDLAKLSLYTYNGQHPNPTIRGIAAILTRTMPSSYGDITSVIVQPNGGKYNTSDKVLLTSGNQTSYGTEHKGNVLIQPVAYYGIMVHSWTVTSFNCNDILQGTDYSYTGKLSYDPETTTLTMDNLQTEGASRASGIRIFKTPYEYSWTNLQLIGENVWTKKCNDIIVKDGNLQFTGNGSLTYPADIVLVRNASELGTSTSQGMISITYSTINANGIRSEVLGNADNDKEMANGELFIYNSDVTLTGSSSDTGTISGFAAEPWIYGTNIVTPAGATWYDNTDATGNRYTYLTADGSTEYKGKVEMYPFYGIFVAGTEITSRNKNDVLNDGGSVSYHNGDVDTPYEEDPTAWMPHLILNRANINGNIVMQESYQDGELIVQLNGDNTINAGRSTGIQSQQPFVVWSKDAYGKLYVKGTGGGVELMNYADMTVANAELNINIGTFGIKGQCTGEDPTGTNNELGGYERVRVLSNNPYASPNGTGTDNGNGELYYSKLVVKNGNRSYPLVSALYDFDFEDCAVMEPTRAYFDREKYAFVGSNGTTLTNTTLVISNADYNTVGIEEVEKADITNAGNVYDLSGRKMNNTRIQRGVYIVNGKKIAVK